MVNSVAGGGTLITFPTLLGLGLSEKSANATSTIGLWPGSLGGAWGYRADIGHQGRQAWQFFVVSLIGGSVGALLLLLTPAGIFKVLVPWLILGATLLFMAQGPISRWLRSRGAAKAAEGHPHRSRWWLVLPLQFLVAVYGGYFGAGIGILMLAALGLLGLDDIHQMNGIKTLGALCINGVAVAIFVFSGLVDWPVAVVMAVGALTGGYLGAGFAKRIGPTAVRWSVIGIGLASAAWTGVRLLV